MKLRTFANRLGREFLSLYRVSGHSSMVTSEQLSDTATTNRQAELLGQAIVEYLYQLLGSTRDRHIGRLVGFPLPSCVDPDLESAVQTELINVVGEDWIARFRTSDRDVLADRITNQLSGPSGAHSRDALWALLGGDDRMSQDWRPLSGTANRYTHTARGRRWLGRRQRLWIVRQTAAALMNVVIAATLAVAWAVLWRTDSTPPVVNWPTLALKGFALWCFAFLPCWLYVRFLGQRAGALWDEYVLNLHRLAWDKPRFLPRPPRTSEFYKEWGDDGGRSQIQERNIYRQKFNAYYGRSVAETAGGEDYRVRLDTLFPVFVTTAVLSVGWIVMLWNVNFLSNPSDVWDVLKFGFLGAYVFIIQMLLRRFFASDLRPSAYTSALLRISVVLLSVAAVYQLLEIWLAGNQYVRRWEAVVAFAIGFLPVMATQVIIRAASAPLRMANRSLESDYPLNQLDGLNIWYEAQLAEENIDDMQNLTTANLVDILLHTRVPVGRLVDWVDQAFLFLHLDRVERGLREGQRARAPSQPDRRVNRPMDEAAQNTSSTHAGVPGSLVGLAGSSFGPVSRGGTRTRTVLRQLGVRTATDLLKAFPPEQVDPLPNAVDTPDRAGLCAALDQSQVAQIRTLVRVLSEEQGLGAVWNWQDRGVRARCPQRQPRSVRACALYQTNDAFMVQHLTPGTPAPTLSIPRQRTSEDHRRNGDTPRDANGRLQV